MNLPTQKSPQLNTFPTGFYFLIGRIRLGLQTDKQDVSRGGKVWAWRDASIFRSQALLACN